MSEGRRALEDLGPALVKAREIRYLNPGRFDDVTDSELEIAARHLRAISYSTVEGAKLLERILLLRRGSKT